MRLTSDVCLIVYKITLIQRRSIKIPGVHLFTEETDHFEGVHIGEKNKVGSSALLHIAGLIGQQAAGGDVDLVQEVMVMPMQLCSVSTFN